MKLGDLDIEIRRSKRKKTITLNFHWKCIMAKPMIIDYLIVHELTHLKYPQHNRQFWDAVFSVMPNYKECEE